MREKHNFFVYIAALAYQAISKEVENRVFRHNRILDTHACVNNPY